LQTQRLSGQWGSGRERRSAICGSNALVGFDRALGMCLNNSLFVTQRSSADSELLGALWPAASATLFFQEI
jgi:hypothetical protein